MHKAAIIGYGGMGSWHANHVKQSSCSEVCGIYDISEEKLRKAEAAGFHTYGSLEELLRSDAEFCVVATPNDTHCAIVQACLNAGKHVISEKPVALNLEELSLMYQAAKKNDRLFTVHQNRRWDVDFLAIREILSEKRLGEVLNVESRIHGSRGIPGDWRRKKASGGGMLYDWGIHLIDQILQFFPEDKVRTVQCQTSHCLEPEVDDGFYLTLMFESGVRAFVEVNTCNFIAMPRFYVTGRKGTAMIRDWRENCQVTECFAWHESDVLPEARGAGITKTMAPRNEITTRSYEWIRPLSDGFRFLDNFCKAMEGTEPLIVTEQQAKHSLRVIQAAFISAERNQEQIQLSDWE